MTELSEALVILSTEAQETLLTDVRQRSRIEACGLLTGSIDEQGNWRVEQAHPLPNIFDSPSYFEFAPEDILAVELAYPGQVIGAYHSHPQGPRAASQTDRANMQRVNVEQQIPWVWLIICGPFDDPQIGFTRSEDEQNGQRGVALLAYHHYEAEGLKQVRVRFAPPGTTAGSEQDAPGRRG